MGNKLAGARITLNILGRYDGAKGFDMLTGHKLRMGKIFRDDGKTFIVAMDHGLGGPQPGLIDPGDTIAKVIAGKPDAILTNMGVINKYADQLSKLHAVLLTIPSDRTAIPYIKQAIKLGVDGVKVSYFGPFDRAKYMAWRDIAIECHEWGMPLMTEPVPMTKGPREGGVFITDAKMVARVARMCFELGADILKVAYTGSPASFREVVTACPAPVTILGGAKIENERDALEVIKGAIDGGGAGITMGRNVWKVPNVTGMVRAIAKIIHENATVDDAIKEL
jgi:DhnA family fructose-bisphosphate aldolase class Ia